MNLLKCMAFTATAAVSIASGAVFAATNTDAIIFNAGGACQSNNTAVNDVRNRVGGVINVGAASIYVICSGPTEWKTGSAYDGVHQVDVRVSNTTGVTKNIQCTLQPGYATSSDGATMSQGSFPKQVNLAAGTATYLTWYRTDVVGAESTDEISSPNVICLLPQGTMVHFLFYTLPEEIGT